MVGYLRPDKKNKPKSYIEIRDSDTDRATNFIVAQLCDLLHEVHRFSTVTLIQLETSINSIVAYNKDKGHDQYLTLFEEVETLNNKIRLINIEGGLPQGTRPQV